MLVSKTEYIPLLLFVNHFIVHLYYNCKLLWPTTYISLSRQSLYDVLLIYTLLIEEENYTSEVTQLTSLLCPTCGELSQKNFWTSNKHGKKRESKASKFWSKMSSNFFFYPLNFAILWMEQVGLFVFLSFSFLISNKGNCKYNADYCGFQWDTTYDDL